uniref:Uncharacterized protein n=1 Tax=viral metagenome TaxID=1070528 RepID=A0A6C0CFC1_9ZZZZ
MESDGSELAASLEGFLKAYRSNNLWFNFGTTEVITDEELRKRLGEGVFSLDEVSNKPDIFPVFGNIKDAVDYHMPALVAYVRSIKETSSSTTLKTKSMATSTRTKRPQPAPSRPQPVEVRGHLELYKKVRGFKWLSDSCFMDSPLVGMFAFKGSPFYENMVVKDLDYNPVELLCGNDEETDEKIRRQIQETLRTDVEELIAGRKFYICSNLRTLVGDSCRPTREVREKIGKTQKTKTVVKRIGLNLAKGIHDPDELYTRLTGALEYSPLEYESYYEYSVDSVWYRISTIIHASTGTLRLNASDKTLDKIRWPGTWDGIISELDTMNIDQQVINDLRTEGASDDVIREIRSLSNRRGIIRKERLVLKKADCFVVSVNRRDYRKPGETGVLTRSIEVDHVMNIDLNGEKKRFVLQAVAYPPRAGHYCCLLKNGTTWFDYNDLDTSKTIAENAIQEARAREIINTRGVLLFYF